VAIEIGTGGYRPHAAAQVLRTRYGDCKDKATLLSTLVQQLGLKSYLLLVHSSRGAVAPEFPSPLNFNHVVLAIAVTEELKAMSLFAIKHHDRLGDLLLFDPTDSATPFGQLPIALQGGHGLLVTEQGGELLELPVAAPAGNRLMRTATMALSRDGSLAGHLQEILWGSPASDWRYAHQRANDSERRKMLESKFSRLGGVSFNSATAEGIDRSGPLVLRFGLEVDSYAQRAGDLLLVRPRITGAKAENLGKQGKPRTLPFVFDSTTLQTDLYEITLPEGYELDELPEPVEVVHDFGEYHSKTELEGRVLRYSRSYTIKQLQVPPERLGDLRAFFDAITLDERAYAVLKRLAP